MSLYRPLEAPTGDARASSCSARAADPRSPTCCRCSRTWACEVDDERPYEITPRDGPPVWIYDFGLRYDDGAELDADDVRETLPGRVPRASGAARPRTTASTGWSSRARLTWREVTVLRAFASTCARRARTFSQTLHRGGARSRTRTSRALLVELFARALRSRRAADADAQARALERRDRGGDRRGREPRRGPHPARLPRA